MGHKFLLTLLKICAWTSEILKHGCTELLSVLELHHYCLFLWNGNLVV